MYYLARLLFDSMPVCITTATSKTPVANSVVIVQLDSLIDINIRFVYRGLYILEKCLHSGGSFYVIFMILVHES